MSDNPVEELKNGIKTKQQAAEEKRDAEERERKAAKDKTEAAKKEQEAAEKTKAAISKIRNGFVNRVIVFIDVVGSTSLKQKYKGTPEEWIYLLEVFRDTLTTAINADGRVVKYIGDEVMASFDDVPPASNFLSKIFEIGETLKQCTNSQIIFKVAVDYGEVYEHKYTLGSDSDKATVLDPQGTTVDRCARIAEYGIGGEIVSSEYFRNETNKTLWHKIGTTVLRGLEKEETIYQYERDTIKLKSYPQTLESENEQLNNENETLKKQNEDAKRERDELQKKLDEVKYEEKKTASIISPKTDLVRRQKLKKRIIIITGAIFLIAIAMILFFWKFGNNDNGIEQLLPPSDAEQPPVPNGYGAEPEPPIPDITTVRLSAGYGHTVAIIDGLLCAWGRNQLGQLGDGSDYYYRNIPVLIEGEGWLYASVGWFHTAAIKGGSLWAWGRNRYGQLGNGSADYSSVPISMGEYTDWIHVSAGGEHTVGIREDGSLWAWGWNRFGQLGIDSTKNNSSMPVQVGRYTDWRYVDAGGEHTVGIREGGTLWIWGQNYYGQLGTGSTDDSPVPVQIGEGSYWVSVSAGSWHTVAICAGGLLWTWGRNLWGQLGNNTTDNSPVPIPVGEYADWIFVNAGGRHTVGMRDNGSLWAWGWNNHGQLGIGSTENSSTPAQIGEYLGWAYVSAGTHHTVAVKKDGSFWAWGYNGNGQLGNGTTDSSLVPMYTVALDYWEGK